MDSELVARRFFEEVWNARRLHVVDEIIAADCVTHQLRSTDEPMPSEPRGPQALKEHILSWLAAFPDLRWEIESIVTEGDRVVTWAMAHGTHQGSWLGIGPTGRRVAIRCVVLHRVADGRIVEDWVVTEALGFFQQLGIVPDTPDADRECSRPLSEALRDSQGLISLSPVPGPGEPNQLSGAGRPSPSPTPSAGSNPVGDASALMAN